jgi:hypothetical protein
MDRIKNFISVIPLQPEGRLGSGAYAAESGSLLDARIETRFPIMNAIAGYAKGDEKIKVTCVLTEYGNARKNYALFQEELKALSGEKGFGFELVEIPTPYRQSADAKLELFAGIIDKLGDDEELFACITYGNKPTTQVLPMALNYAYRTKKNVAVECVVYGEFDHGSGKMRLYDTTPLFYMDAIVNNLAEAKVKNPAEAIKKILSLK